MRAFGVVATVDGVVDEQARIRSGARDLIVGVTEQLPSVVTALVVVAIFVALAWVVRHGVRRLLLWRTGRPSFAEVLSRIARAVVITLGILIGLVIAAPSVDVAQIVGGLGVSSIAIGFAFKDILQNSLAGLLLLFREPFRTGDEIEVDDWRGIVEAITIRETRLRTFDNRRVLLANTDIYGKAVAVQTAYDKRRTTLAIGIDYEGDLSHAQTVVLDAATGVDGVLDAPPPHAHYTTFATSTLALELRYWTAPNEETVNAVRDRMVQAVKTACERADVALPADIVEVDLRSGAREVLSALRGPSEGVNRR
ncbi:mechanosensitive ion channel family protein [soil metagenome]